MACRRATLRTNAFAMLLRLALLALAARLVLAAACAAALAGTEVQFVIVGDQHSAYERTAQLVAHVDRLRAEDATLPLAVLIDGDAFEYGNVVARRSAGAIDFAMFAALARRAPTVLNLGNHEPEFHDVAETVRRIEATGVKVVSNLGNRATSAPFAPATTSLKVGASEAVVVGLSTDNLATFRVAIRPALDLADPVVWAKKNLPGLLATAPIKIVLSHVGVRQDREILPLVPDGTLFAGAHDHLRFVHGEGGSVYVHSGSWNESFTLARLRRDARGAPTWEIQQVPISARDPADPDLAAFIRETEANYLEAADRAIVGRTPRALSVAEAAMFVADAVRQIAKVDAAFIGNTTFGAGLPAGEVTQLAFDACVRFDGTIFTGEVDGPQLRTLLAAANQGPATSWADRRGEFLFATGPSEIVSERRYRIAVDNWVSRNALKYLGTDKIVLTEQPALKLKSIAVGSLAGGRDGAGK